MGRRGKRGRMGGRRQHRIIDDITQLLQKKEDCLTDLQVEHLVHLERLVRFYVRFLAKWEVGEVHIEQKVGKPLVRIRWSKVVSKQDAFDGIVKYYPIFTEREFRLDKLKARTLSYKRKIRNEFSKRHENPKVNGSS